MNTKFTPEYVLKMLQEIKELSDQDGFYFSILTKKYPSFSIFKNILFNKGIISKGRGKAKWISIIPNIIMAKEVSRLFLEKREQYLENWLNNKLNESDNGSDNEIKITENNPPSISILKELENPELFKKNQPFKNPTMSYAKEIRKEGEKWNDAVSRASAIIKKEKNKLIKIESINDSDLHKIIDENENLKQELKEVTKKLEFSERVLEDNISEKFDKYKFEKEIQELKQQLEFEKLANNNDVDLHNEIYKEKEFYKNNVKRFEEEADRWKHEVENMNVVLHKETKIHEKESQDLINKLQISNKDLQFYKEKYEDLEQRNKKYIAEYSAFINEKLEVIEDLKKQLHQQQSEKNQVSVIKVLGIPLIKKTTKTIK